jgi:hypothetical protein
MELHDGAGDGLLVAVFHGTLPAGSECNAHVSEWQRRIEATLSERSAGAKGLVLDMTRLDYSFGDAIGGLWLVPTSRGIPCAVAAQGRTADAIRRLLGVAPAFGPALCASPEEARQVLSAGRQ